MRVNEVETQVRAQDAEILTNFLVVGSEFRKIHEEMVENWPEETKTECLKQIATGVSDKLTAWTSSLECDRETLKAEHDQRADMLIEQFRVGMELADHTHFTAATSFDAAAGMHEGISKGTAEKGDSENAVLKQRIAECHLMLEAKEATITSREAIITSHDELIANLRSEVLKLERR
jgi:hypothetical protein